MSLFAMARGLLDPQPAELYGSAELVRKKMPANSYTIGQKVELHILRETNLGFVARIDGRDEGLLFHNEIFERLEVGQRLPGYIKKIREDETIDLSLQLPGTLGAEELGERILDLLKHRGGTIPINAKSPAEDIYDFFGVSRNKFKIALGALYKKRLIEFTETGTKLVADKV